MEQYIKGYLKDDFPLDKAYKKTYSFIEYLDKDGFAPSIGAIPISVKPYISLIGGSHRLGWILEKHENAFIPVSICPPYKRVGDWNEDGIELLLNKSSADGEYIILLLERYRKLLGSIRRSVIGIVCADITENSLKEFLSSYGDVVSVSEILILNKRVARRLKLSSNKPYRIVNLSLSYNQLEYKKGHFISNNITLLNKELKKRFGDECGYFAGSITESVEIERYLFPKKANL